MPRAPVAESRLIGFGPGIEVVLGFKAENCLTLEAELEPAFWVNRSGARPPALNPKQN